MSEELSVFVGYHSPAAEAYEICKYSIEKYASRDVSVYPLKQQELRDRGLYSRPIDQRASNEFSMTRWLAPYLAKSRFALFMDSDMIFTGDIFRLLQNLDSTKAVHVVQHDYTPKSTTKMSDDGAVKQQYVYPRKNWSSFVLWNCEHAAVSQLTPELVNSAEPKYLHRFSFLEDDQIGDIGSWIVAKDGEDVCRVPTVNFLVGEYPVPQQLPLVLHYTLAIPGIHDCGACSDYYKEWMDMRAESRIASAVNQLQNSSASPVRHAA